MFTCHFSLWGEELVGFWGGGEAPGEPFGEASEMWSSSPLRVSLHFKYIFKYQKYLLGDKHCPVNGTAPGLAWGQHHPVLLGIPAVSFCVRLTTLKVLWLCVLTFSLPWKDFCRSNKILSITSRYTSDHLTDPVDYTHPCSEFWVGVAELVIPWRRAHWKK